MNKTQYRYKSPAMRRLDRLLRDAGEGGIREWVAKQRKQGASSHRMARMLAILFPDDECLPTQQGVNRWIHHFAKEEGK